MENLLSDVHQVIYGDAAEFSIVPMPRLSIESMQDIKDLVEAGVILPEKCVRLVDILLGSQNLPVSGNQGEEYARKIQKLIHEPKPSASSSTSSSSAAKKSSSKK